MKKTSFTLILFFSFSLLFAQDLIYVITGEIDKVKTSLDSILVENLNNGSRIVFENLPKQENYQINLSKNAFWGGVGIENFERTSAFVVATNSPGVLTINYVENNPTNIRLSVYTNNGLCVYSSEQKMVNARNSIRVQLSNSGVHFVRIDVQGFSQTFKAIGTSNNGKYAMGIVDWVDTQTTNKSGAISSDSDKDFSFIPGDSIRVSAYKNGYSAHSVGKNIFSSENINFQFEVGPTYTDYRDGKVYKIVKIGTQIWMAENLAYLPSVSPPTVRANYYVTYYNGTSISEAKATDMYKTYGVLYTWVAAQTACPSADGWHLSVNAEWEQMEREMSQNKAGSTCCKENKFGAKLKTTSGWYDNGNGTNDFGFSALPGGILHPKGRFDFATGWGYWWCTTKDTLICPSTRVLSYESDEIYGGNLCGTSPCCMEDRIVNEAFSVRCVRD